MRNHDVFWAFVKGAAVNSSSESMAPIGAATMRSLLRAYRRNPKVVEWLGLYADLKDIFEAGEDFEGGLGLPLIFKRGIGQIDSMLDTEQARNRFDSQQSRLLTSLRKVDSGRKVPDTVWREIIETYVDLIQAMGTDKRIHMRPRKLPGKGAVRFMRLQRASPKEEAIERLRSEDPDLYERMRQSRKQIRAINEEVRKRIERDGRTPEVRTLLNRPMNVGIGADGSMLVYDRDGDATGWTGTVEEFVDRVKSKRQTSDRLQRVNPARNMYYSELDALRVLPVGDEEDLDPVGEVQSISLTDDPDKDSSLTRIYEVGNVRDENGDLVEVVVSGRFKGIPVANLVNAMGRQVEGSSYYFNPETKRIGKRELKGDGGEADVRRQSEPYVTVHKDKLFIHIPAQRMFKRAKKALQKMAKENPNVEKLRGAKTFLFTPNEFEEVRQQIGGMALSTSAAKMLRDYYDELSKAERAADAKNLKRYSSESLGLRLPLRNHVKKALAWLDANGNKGICALDTGMGKTVTAIASIQNLIKKGETGRYLYVCDAALVGNLPKEIYKFLEKSEADSLMEMVDVISYRDFNKMRREDDAYGDDYVAIYFDEAHKYMAKKSQASYKAAVGVKAPHKIMLTASPMQRSPLEVLTMASVANGDDLNDKEGRRQQKAFVKRFCENVGGRIVGIQQEDPAKAKEFRTWAKRNLFFAAKKENDEFEGLTTPQEDEAKIEDLRRETEAVTMPPMIEDEYRNTMEELLSTMKEVVAEGPLEDVDMSDPAQLAVVFEQSRNKRALSQLFKKLTMLSDTPNRLVPGAPNPKLDRAAAIIENHVSGQTLMFTDSEPLAEDTFARMRQKFPGKTHVLGLGSKILKSTPSGEVERFTKRAYTDPKTGREVPKSEWKTHVLNNYVRNDPSLGTAVLTGSYALGQNLQNFNTVIHLDRDDWSNEVMKQRTARAWRAGNKAPVDEYTLDLTYPDAVEDDDASKTLDEIRQMMQEIDENLFNQVVLASQVERLGEEWLSIKHQRSALHKIDKQMMERALSPYASQMGRGENEV